jgi:type I restriction enzyme S subunit
MSSAEWLLRGVDDVRRDASDGLATGPFGSSVSAKFFQDDGVPLIRGSNLSEAVGERLVEDDYVFVSEEKAAEFPRAVARSGDLIFTCWGTIGQVGLIDGRARFDRYLISNKQMKLSPDPSKADSLFLYYLFKSPDLQAAIRSVSIGSSVPGFNLGQLRGLRFPLPPLAEQKEVAAVLGALDDKIEQNRRTGQALEELARATFKAWFVDFEPVKAKAAGQTNFPGMDPATFASLPDRLTDSAFGLVPRGWAVGTLGDLLNERGERMAPGEETRRLPYVPIDCITSKRVTLERFRSGEEAQSSLIRFRSGDILFGAMRPYFHKVCLAPFVGTTRTTCFVLTPRTESDTAFALMLASEDATVQFATTSSVGSTIPYAKWKNSLSEMPCVVPPQGLRAAYQAVAEPMLQLGNQGVGESFRLAALRDNLMPRLLSGKVRVRLSKAEVNA